GRRFQSAAAFIAALDAALRDPGAGGDGTVAFAPLPPVVPPPQEAAAEERREEERRWNRRWLAVLAAVLIGALVGFALTRDTTTSVPEVTGKQLPTAVALLEQDGFKVGAVKRVQREAPRNKVLEQDPLASPPAGRASLDCAFLTLFCSKPKVSLTVSAGPGRAKVPGTAGMSREAAVTALRAAGFKASLKRVSSEKVAAGLVIGSSPAGGTLAGRGSTVTLTVSTGPKQVTVPVLVGTQRAVAEQQIRARGLVPEVSEKPSSTAAGEVISQSPNAGSKLPRGSTVSIVVSKGQRKVGVPNLIGRERAAAEQMLRAAGLRFSVQEQETEAAAQVGRVTDQFPPPGSEVDPGTVVTLVVGKAKPESTVPGAPKGESTTPGGRAP
ncbi:MAG TPA: PASTA domain-containing protein, partial [Solirubrobacterales bacterium]